MAKPIKPRDRFEQWGRIKGIRIKHLYGDKITLVWASSRGRPGEWHMVDLEAFNLHGKCSCEAFQFQCERHALKEQNLPFHERTPKRCDHIKAAREWMLTRFLREIASPKGTSLYNQHD